MTDALTLHAQIKDYRRKIANGEEVTDDELREAIRLLHEHRNGSHQSLEKASRDKGKKIATAASKAEAKQKAHNLLGDLF